MAIISGQTSGNVSKTVLVDSLGRLVVSADSVAAQNIFGATTIASGATTTVVTYTVPAGVDYNLYTVSVGGNEKGIFDVKIDGVTILRIRNSGANPTVSQIIGVSESQPPGTVISISCSNESSFTKDYEGTLFGQEREI